MSQAQPANKRRIRATVRDDGITLVFQDTQLTEDGQVLHLTRDNICPEALEAVTLAEARNAASDVLTRPNCVQRADVTPFELHALLPRVGKTREKQKLADGIIQYFESAGFLVTICDQRRSLRAAS